MTGTNGVDRLVSFQIVAEFNKIVNELETNFVRDKTAIEYFAILDDHLGTETPNGIITGKIKLFVYFTSNLHLFTFKPCSV